MRQSVETVQPQIATIHVGSKRLGVSVRVAYDGVEYLGRLWFAEHEWDGGIPDRGVLPGRTHDEVMDLARRLTETELVARYRRAATTTRRYKALRGIIEDFLLKVRYLNQVAISMRAGHIDLEGAAQEIDITEHQLHELIRRLRDAAGVEDTGA